MICAWALALCAAAPVPTSSATEPTVPEVSPPAATADTPDAGLAGDELEEEGFDVSTLPRIFTVGLSMRWIVPVATRARKMSLRSSGPDCIAAGPADAHRAC